VFVILGKDLAVPLGAQRRKQARRSDKIARHDRDLAQIVLNARTHILGEDDEAAIAVQFRLQSGDIGHARTLVQLRSRRANGFAERGAVSQLPICREQELEANVILTVRLAEQNAQTAPARARGESLLDAWLHRQVLGRRVLRYQQWRSCRQRRHPARVEKLPLAPPGAPTDQRGAAVHRAHVVNDVAFANQGEQVVTSKIDGVRTSDLQSLDHA